MDKKLLKGRLPLFFALSSYFLLPFIYQCIQTYLIVQIPFVDGLGIAGHIEWFDLINETIEAFLITSLYHIYNEAVDNRGKLSYRIKYSLWISSAIYAVFALLVYFQVSRLTVLMAGEENILVTKYLQIETVAFLTGHLSSVFIVIFVTLGYPKYIYMLAAVKTAGTIIGDYILIPNLGVNGVAFANIAVNGLLDILCILLLFKEKLPRSEKEDKGWLVKWAKIGFFSGGQVFLDNLLYALLVCKMINAVEEQGNYWVANNFIWGFLLVPVFALNEIIKRENSPKEYLTYFKILGYIIIFWVLSAFLWKPFLKYGMGIKEPDTILSILFTVMPFYIAYGFSMIFNSIFVSTGKTYYNTIISFVVNIGYYGIMSVIFSTGVIKPGITFVCFLFGGGMLVNAVAGGAIFFHRFFRQRKAV